MVSTSFSDRVDVFSPPLGVSWFSHNINSSLRPCVCRGSVIIVIVLSALGCVVVQS